MSWSPSTMRWGKKKVHISCNKLDALLPPQEAIVTHWITVVVGSSATHLLKLCRINLLPTIAYKKEKIKLDPPVSAAGASPLWRDSMTHWPSSWHSAPIPLLHAHFLHSTIVPMSYSTRSIIRLGVCVISHACAHVGGSRWCSSGVRSSLGANLSDFYSVGRNAS